MTQPPPDQPTAPVTLWLTDRTRSETGLARCLRKRYLNTSFGPTGYGIVPAGESLPKVTGLAVHEAFAGLCQTMMAEDRLPTIEETRAIVLAAQDAYVLKVEKKGYLGILAGPQTSETIAEQRVLISGLIWALRLRWMPWFHEHFRVLSIEEERLHFLSCTCGAGPLPPEAHIARGCTGVVLMLRRDCLAERRGGSSLAYFEVKTTGWDSEAWVESWETKPQLAIGTLDVEKQWPGKEVTELYIVGLNKGRRMKDRYGDDAPEDQRKKQQTALCYGYARPGNPPLMTEDWLPSYEWIDDGGTVRRKSKAHRRKGIWELANSDWPTWTAYHLQDPEMPPEEFWVRNLPTAVLDKVCFLVGPMNRQEYQLQSLTRGMLADEERWQGILWELYEIGLTHPWASPEFQAALDRLVPCSWNCQPFGREQRCEGVPICHHHEGWEDPLATGKFKPRRPHHDPELQAAIARGLLVADTEDQPEDDE